ncbi:MAG TPA: hypothetical protein VG096_10555 [Bryobacteraceae bacterium]|jgi:hypothetical protein|nr:hypothetical protein [Bryobacteraceae bacterium]
MSFLRKVNESTIVVDEPINAGEPAKPAAPRLNTGTTTKTNTNTNIEGARQFLSAEFADDLRKRWDGVQAAFVDEPREAVEQADELVASTIKKLTEAFNEARNNLEGQTRGNQVDTEDLRITLKKYRSLFQKLTTV